MTPPSSSRRAAGRSGRPSTRLPRGDRTAPPGEIVRRARRVNRKLAAAYPDARCALHFESPLDLYVATVLSAQCTDERVNKVTPELFRRCRRPEDYLALGPQGLEAIIQSTGFFRAKARNILAGCQRILEAHDGVLPRTMEELVQIPGCGRKTANVILGNVFATPGITVDTHMGRIARRLGLTREEDPVKVEAALQLLLPEKEWTEFSHRVIAHGRTICDARKPRCEICPLRTDCPWPASAGSARPATQGAARKSSPRKPETPAPAPRRAGRGDSARPKPRAPRRRG